MSQAIAILGATGTVGQKLISLVLRDSNFEIAELAASDEKIGKKYDDVVNWRETTPLPEKISKIPLKSYKDIQSPYVLSALPANIALKIEPFLAQKGINVFSNASAMRMNNDTPILIPEINLEHLSLVNQQSSSGKIVTNSNCVATPLSLTLFPLMKLGNIETVNLVTLQALSGAGYPGVPSLDIMGNVIPYIKEEESKIVEETKKILGTKDSYASFELHPQVFRVPVQHGHSLAITITFKNTVSKQAAIEEYTKMNKQFPNVYKIYHELDHPQPLKDLDNFDHRVHIGQIKQRQNNVLSMVSIAHNLVRGAAGATLANLKAFIEKFEVK